VRRNAAEKKSNASNKKIITGSGITSCPKKQ